jgi:hypothetical protein
VIGPWGISLFSSGMSQAGKADGALGARGGRGGIGLFARDDRVLFELLDSTLG